MITNDEYSSRRQRILELIGKDAVAIIQGAPHVRSHDKFRQANDFHYLCGVEVPRAYLGIDGRDGSTTLFLPYQSEAHAAGEGVVLSAGHPDEAIKASGVDAVRGVDDIAAFLEKTTDIYTPMRQGEGPSENWDTLQRGQQERHADPWDGQPDRMRHFVSLLRIRCPYAAIHDLAPTLNEMRIIKSTAEIALLREAGRITGIAVTEAMKCTRPGVMEYELDAVLRYVYLASGAREAGYRAIIASGENAWYGHYNKNDAELQDGDLILVDCAPDYHYYTSDIGRMFPINGVYTDVQRQLYGLMVEYHKVLLSLLGPGEHDAKIRTEASARMKKVVDSTKWTKPIYEEAARRALEMPYPLTHPVGMSVHDVGHYRGSPLVPGVVLTVDPQLIIPEERKYIRVEDTVVITDNGIENFTAPAPLELDEVEEVMRREGILQAFPPSSFGMLAPR